jgi:O-antigen/teichoic acid export membrane protein
VRVPEWFRDRAVRRVAKFGVPIALGKFATAISGVITLAILARHLGKEALGVIAVFRTVVTMVDLFANFNTWQAIIKYGTEAIAQNRKQDVDQLIKLAAVIDITTAWVGALVVVGLAFVVPGQFDWSRHESTLCAIYALTLVSKLAGTTDGIFRICDSYRVQAIAASIMALVTTGAVAIAVVLGAGFDGCVYVLIGGEVAANAVITVAAFWVARRHGFGNWFSTSLSGVRAKFPGIARFLVSTNAQLTVKTMQSEVDMIIVGSSLGKASAGLFRVIKQLGTIPGRVFMPFEIVLYTELAREVAARDYRSLRRLLRRSMLIAGIGTLVLWLVVAPFSRPIIGVIAGPDFLDAAPAFRVYLFAMALMITGSPAMRTMIVLGRPGTLFLFDLGSLVLLIVGAVVLAHQWGLVGIAIALVIHRAVQLLWPMLFLRGYLRRAEREQNT